jgi:hypothetical protein
LYAAAIFNPNEYIYAVEEAQFITTEFRRNEKLAGCLMEKANEFYKILAHIP